MATDLQITGTVALLGSYQVTGELTDRSRRIATSSPTTFAGGSAGRYYGATRTNAGALETIDLDGDLSDVDGDPISFTSLRWLWIWNQATTGTLTVAGSFLDTYWQAAITGRALAPGEEVYIKSTAGITITGGANSELELTGSTTLAYRLEIVGA